MKRWITRLLALGTALQTHAALHSDAELKTQVQTWMADHPVMSEASMEIADISAFPTNGDYSVYVVKLEPSGFLIVNSSDRLPFIISFSPTGPLNLADTPENALRNMLLSYCEEMAENLADTDFTVTTSDATLLTPSELHGPFLETTWDQSNPYNLLCPDAPSGSQYNGYRAPAGCVPVVFAQILYYHRWPLKGEGSRSYTDDSGSITGTHSADFSNAYNWEAMSTYYNPWDTSSNTSKTAVAELMYELGVAAGVNYEADETSGNHQNLGNRLETYFNFEPIAFHLSEADLIAPMEADLRAGFPCIISLPTHAVVADGLMVESGITTYHINYGWGGTNNGWWASSSIPGGNIQNGITSLRPQLMAIPQSDSLSCEASESVDLNWILPKRRENEVAKLEIRRYETDNGGWTSFVEDTTLASHRFEETTILLDDGDDFSFFEQTTTSPIYTQDWTTENISGIGNCFYKAVPEYQNYTYHLTSRTTITPTATTRLILRAKYTLSTDPFSVLVSTDRSSFTEIWSVSDTMEWTDVAIDLSSYAGQPIYIRLQYTGGGYWPSGGVWVDSVSQQEATNQEYEDQPVYYTTLTNLNPGTYTLTAVLTDQDGIEYTPGPPLTLTVQEAQNPDQDGDGMPDAWEQLYALNTSENDSSLDPDQDGFNNLMEYIAGTVPTNKNSRWAMTMGSNALPAFQVIENRLYSIEYCNSLSNSWHVLTNNITSNSNALYQVSQYESTTNETRFYRIKVQTSE